MKPKTDTTMYYLKDKCDACGGKLRYATDYYMLKNSVWKKVMPNNDEHKLLHITCAEIRLGRAFRKRDFMPGVALNEGVFGFTIRGFEP